MSYILKKDTDFTWGKINNDYGIAFRCPVLNDREKLRPISEPRRNSVVYTYNEDTQELIPVLIKDGQYLDPQYGRVLNFWEWYELNDQLQITEEQSGYGFFFKPSKKFKVKVKYEVITE